MFLFAFPWHCMNIQNAALHAVKNLFGGNLYAGRMRTLTPLDSERKMTK